MKVSIKKLLKQPDALRLLTLNAAIELAQAKAVKAKNEPTARSEEILAFDLDLKKQAA